MNDFRKLLRPSPTIPIEEVKEKLRIAAKADPEQTMNYICNEFPTGLDKTDGNERARCLFDLERIIENSTDAECAFAFGRFGPTDTQEH